MKREADGDMGSPQKRSRRGDEEVRLLIPSKVAGSIIGKGGQNITKLRSQYKASITVPDCPGPERMLTLSSDLDTICNIVKDVVPHLEENGARAGNGNELDLRMMIHQSQAGCIIGRAGFKIKELRDKTGARIKIFSNLAPNSTDRVIQIIGEPAKCIDAIREVLTLAKTSPIKGVVNPYDPHNFDDYYADEYGGWTSMNSGGGGGGGRRDNRGGGGGGGGGNRNGFRDGPNNRRGGNMSRGGGGGGGRSGGPMGGGFNDRQGGGGGGMMRNGFGGGGGRGMNGGGGGGGFDRGNNPGPWANGNGMNGGGGGGGNFNQMSNNLMGNGFNSMPPPLSGGGGGGGMDRSNPSSTQVTIPKDLAGAIIGKGGGRIRKIRQDSGAGITIEEPLPGSSERIITISGSSTQIQMAQYLLQQSVHNNADRRF